MIIIIFLKAHRIFKCVVWLRLKVIHWLLDVLIAQLVLSAAPRLISPGIYLFMLFFLALSFVSILLDGVFYCIDSLKKLIKQVLVVAFRLFIFRFFNNYLTLPSMAALILWTGQLVFYIYIRLWNLKLLLILTLIGRQREKLTSWGLFIRGVFRQALAKRNLVLATYLVTTRRHFA